jgi:phage shock protein A
MALLERVGTLLRANLNDLIDRAEDPEKMVKQVILDMENQLMQVKTQVAITIAERALESKKISESFDEQIADQKVQVENLKGALNKLDGKLQEARAKSELLLARHRRARTQTKIADDPSAAAWDRMKHKVDKAEALNEARTELLGDNLEDRFAALEKQDEIERLLESLKGRKELT